MRKRDEGHWTTTVYLYSLHWWIFRMAYMLESVSGYKMWSFQGIPEQCTFNSIMSRINRPALLKFFFLEAIYFLCFHIRRHIESSPTLVILTFSIVHDGLTTNLPIRAYFKWHFIAFLPKFQVGLESMGKLSYMSISIKGCSL